MRDWIARTRLSAHDEEGQGHGVGSGELHGVAIRNWDPEFDHLTWQDGRMGEAVERWRHVEVYTAGQQFLVLDVRLLDAWRGTDEQVDELIELGHEVATLPVGDGVAGIVAVDGTINDEGWLEVFQRGPDRIAVVQGSGWPYREVMVRALSCPVRQRRPMTPSSK